ncbi:MULTISPECIES: MFS transporter [unclassified Streptomyces]|uniref:MFS transporter n=1 Tax=unclassified Streptomyces TaxID=2593676 RepID=UPI003076F1A4
MPRHTTTPSPPLTASDTGPVNTRTQKRVLTVLFASQILSGLGLAAGTTVAALLVQDMLHSTALAGLSSGLLTAGSALAAIAVGRLSQTRGRRPGLATGYLVGALGAAGVITAAATDSPALHVGATYLPSPLTGRLVDRFGPAPLAVWAALTLLASGILAATAPDGSVALLALALVLLGLGWNFGLVSGTAIVTDAVPLTTRARTQGLVDVAVAIAGAAGGMASGPVVAAAGYPVLAITGAALALALLPAIIATARRR